MTRVTATFRARRPPLPREKAWYVIHESMYRGTFTRAWFLSRGCSWDRRGRCTMCNYGHGEAVGDTDMETWAASAFREITSPIDTLFFGPSGSMLDAAEVPTPSRSKILALAARVPASRLAVEARPESVTADALGELEDAFPGRPVSIGMGLESSSAWVQRFSISKGASSNEFADAAAAVRAHGMDVHMNVAIGAPFLAPREAVADAVASALWAWEHGADQVILFPLHVRPDSALATLQQTGHYRVLPLWALVEVLVRLPPERLPSTQISWYRDYGQTPSPPREFPDTCAICHADILRLLDAYRYRPDPSSAAPLRRYRCRCRQQWDEALAHRHAGSPPGRAIAGYRALASAAGLDQWWSVHGDAIEHELQGPLPESDLSRAPAAQ